MYGLGSRQTDVCEAWINAAAASSGNAEVEKSRLSALTIALVLGCPDLDARDEPGTKSQGNRKPRVDRRVWAARRWGTSIGGWAGAFGIHGAVSVFSGIDWLWRKCAESRLWAKDGWNF